MLHKQADTDLLPYLEDPESARALILDKIITGKITTPEQISELHERVFHTLGEHQELTSRYDFVFDSLYWTMQLMNKRTDGFANRLTINKAIFDLYQKCGLEEHAAPVDVEFSPDINRLKFDLHDEDIETLKRLNRSGLTLRAIGDLTYILHQADIGTPIQLILAKVTHRQTLRPTDQEAEIICAQLKYVFTVHDLSYALPEGLDLDFTADELEEIKRVKHWGFSKDVVNTIAVRLHNYIGSDLSPCLESPEKAKEKLLKDFISGEIQGFDEMNEVHERVLRVLHDQDERLPEYDEMFDSLSLTIDLFNKVKWPVDASSAQATLRELYSCCGLDNELSSLQEDPGSQDRSQSRIVLGTDDIRRLERHKESGVTLNALNDLTVVLHQFVDQHKPENSSVIDEDQDSGIFDD